MRIHPKKVKMPNFFQLQYNLFRLKKNLAHISVGKIAISQADSKCICLHYDFRPILQVTEH